MWWCWFYVVCVVCLRLWRILFCLCGESFCRMLWWDLWCWLVVVLVCFCVVILWFWCLFICGNVLRLCVWRVWSWVMMCCRKLLMDFMVFYLIWVCWFLLIDRVIVFLSGIVGMVLCSGMDVFMVFWCWLVIWLCCCLW